MIDRRSPLAKADPTIFQLIRREVERQEQGLELIASENVVTVAVLEAMGTALTNKYAEGLPGKTCLSTSFPNTSWERISPPRGPRRVLCVVVVTMCACGTGDGWMPAATRPAKCAMSTTKIAPTSSATLRSAAKSITRAYALPPPTRMRGRSRRAISRT